MIYGPLGQYLNRLFIVKVLVGQQGRTLAGAFSSHCETLQRFVASSSFIVWWGYSLQSVSTFSLSI